MLLIINTGNFLNDVNLFDARTFTWSNIIDIGSSTPPSPRGAMAASALGETIYFHGGYDQTGGCRPCDVRMFQFSFTFILVYSLNITFPDLLGIFFGDLFQFNVMSSQWLELSGKVSGDIPEGLSGHCIVTCRGLIYLFAGIAKSGESQIYSFIVGIM